MLLKVKNIRKKEKDIYIAKDLSIYIFIRQADAKNYSQSLYPDSGGARYWRAADRSGGVQIVKTNSARRRRSLKYSKPARVSNQVPSTTIQYVLEWGRHFEKIVSFW